MATESRKYQVAKIRYETISTGVEATVFLNPGERIVSIETVNSYHRIVYIEQTREQGASERGN